MSRQRSDPRRAIRTAMKSRGLRGNAVLAVAGVVVIAAIGGAIIWVSGTWGILIGLVVAVVLTIGTTVLVRRRM